MKRRSPEAEAWAVAAAWAAARLAVTPPGHNTHTIMYPLVEATGGYNTLEPFHSLYLPVVTIARRAWELAGAAPPALPAIQAVSLAAGAANVVLLHRLVRRAADDADAALGAALILAVSANLWSWGLMTTSYTLSTACLLSAALVLLSREKLVASDAAKAGLWLGAAAGLDTAAGAAVLAAGWELFRRRSTSEKPARYWAAFLSCAAAPVLLGLLLLTRRLSAAGWPFEPTVAGFLGSLPDDIVPLWRSRDVLAQVRGWAASTAPLDLPVWAAAAVLAWSRTAAKTWSEKALWRLGAGTWLGVCAFFFASDPHNRFIYASLTFVPALFALRRPLAWSVAAAAALLAWHRASPPDYAPDGNLGIEEARYLEGKLGKEDVLVALSEPDYLFAYTWSGRSRVVNATKTEGLEKVLDEALCGGRKAVFAADALFRDSRTPPAILDAEAGRLFQGLSKRYTVEPAWVSPRGQHYLPLKVIKCPK